MSLADELSLVDQQACDATTGFGKDLDFIALLISGESLSDDLVETITQADKPVLDYIEEDYLPAYLEFYHSLLEQEEEVEG